jgi:cytochrome c oxidase subunit II
MDPTPAPKPSKGRRRIALVLATTVALVIGVVYVALILDGVFGNGGKPLTTLSPHGVQSQYIQNLITPVYAVAGVVMVLVFGAVFYIIWRFRDKGEDEGEFPTQLEGNTRLELFWTLLPLLILAVVSVFTVATIVKLNQTNKNALRVEVTGQQWWWSFHYDMDNNGSYTQTAKGDIITANEMIIPVNRQVALTITSNDVIHSFWIPALNGKKDAVPGQHHPLVMEGTKIGVYRGQCTQFCGLSHANMRMIVRVVSQSDFDKWVQNQQTKALTPAPGTEAAAGLAVFKGQLCSSCHLIRGVNDAKIASGSAQKLLIAGVAPDLTHIATRGTFAGSVFNLYDPSNPEAPSQPGDPNNLSLAGNPGGALYGGDSAPFNFNTTALQAWIRNPPADLPESAVTHRGMPNLHLSETQIAQVTAYIESLK